MQRARQQDDVSEVHVHIIRQVAHQLLWIGSGETLGEVLVLVLCAGSGVVLVHMTLHGPRGEPGGGSCTSQDLV